MLHKPEILQRFGPKLLVGEIGSSQTESSQTKMNGRHFGDYRPDKSSETKDIEKEIFQLR